MCLCYLGLEETNGSRSKTVENVRESEETSDTETLSDGELSTNRQLKNTICHYMTNYIH